MKNQDNKSGAAPNSPAEIQAQADKLVEQNDYTKAEKARDILALNKWYAERKAEIRDNAVAERRDYGEQVAKSLREKIMEQEQKERP